MSEPVKYSAEWFKQIVKEPLVKCSERPVPPPVEVLGPQGPRDMVAPGNFPSSPTCRVYVCGVPVMITNIVRSTNTTMVITVKL
jgi:hypothetical protein